VFLSFRYWPPDFGGELLHCIERLQSLTERGHSVVALTRRTESSGHAEQHDSITRRSVRVSGGVH